MLEKKYLRELAKKQRQECLLDNSINICSSKIVSKILSSEIFKNSKNIALYYPLKGEIDITSIMNIKNKIFYLPRCVNLNLEFVRYNVGDDLKIGAHSIKEPKGVAINPEVLDLIFVPALIANTKCYRIGWGKGYYDRFFNTHSINAKKIIITASKFIRDDFIYDKHDVCCDMVMCEREF